MRSETDGQTGRAGGTGDREAVWERKWEKEGVWCVSVGIISLKVEHLFVYGSLKLDDIL